MRVLLVAYDFPPVGGIGVQRVVKFARYLPQFGIEPVVLTNGHGRGRAHDRGLLAANDLDALPVLRLGGDRLAAYHAWRDGGDRFPWALAPALALSTVRYSDVFGLWYASLRHELAALVREYRIEAVWTTVPHASSCFFGLHLARAQGLPWIIDIRDAIAANADRRVMHGVAQVQAWRAAKLEREFVQAADRVIAVSQPIIDNMVGRVGAAQRHKFLLLPNGYDQADMPFSSASPPADKLTLVYAGTFVGRRRPDTLVAGINAAVRSGHIGAGEMRLHFYGRYDVAAMATIAGIDAAVEVQSHGFVTQADAIAAVQQSHVALVVTVPGNDSLAQEVMTGKVFECLGLRKRVLALTDAAPLAAFIAETGLGDTCAAGEPAAVAKALSMLMQRWRRGESLTVEPDAALAARYERRAQTGVLAGQFHELRPAVVPGR